MEPASIRYKNPGAMWGNALAIKWGAQKKAVVLHDGKGQGNNIAVFPTYVQGICAQLDLWRTSKNYRNKRFADAIAIWSGHNEVPSYIAFCKKRVPGLTENTIMNDAFWKSPSGIAFLKAQAWHEAGKKYPAPDPDWIEAQRRVFAGVRTALVVPSPEDAPPNMQPEDPAVLGDPVLYSVQQRLKARRYPPGIIDGKWGSGTSGALSGFMNDRGNRLATVPTNVDEFHEIADEVQAELLKAEAEVQPDGSIGWYRPVSEARAKGDPKLVQELAPEVVPARRNFLAAVWASVVAAFGSVWQTITGYVSQAWDFFTDHQDAIDDHPGIVAKAWEYVTSIPAGFWWLGIAGVLAFFAYNSWRAIKTSTLSVQNGERQ